MQRLKQVYFTLLAACAILVFCFWKGPHDCDRKPDGSRAANSFRLLRDANAGNTEKGTSMEFVAVFEHRVFGLVYCYPLIPQGERWGLHGDNSGGRPLPLKPPALQITLREGETERLGTVHEDCPILIEARFSGTMPGGMFFDEGRILAWPDDGHD